MITEDMIINLFQLTPSQTTGDSVTNVATVKGRSISKEIKKVREDMISEPTPESSPIKLPTKRVNAVPSHIRENNIIDLIQYIPKKALKSIP